MRESPPRTSERAAISTEIWGTRRIYREGPSPRFKKKKEGGLAIGRKSTDYHMLAKWQERKRMSVVHSPRNRGKR